MIRKHNTINVVSIYLYYSQKIFCLKKYLHKFLIYYYKLIQVCMEVNKNSEVVTSEIVSRKELSLRLGIHPATALRYEKEGKIRGFRLGGTARYIWSEVLADLQKIPGYRGR